MDRMLDVRLCSSFLSVESRVRRPPRPCVTEAAAFFQQTNRYAKKIVHRWKRELDLTDHAKQKSRRNSIPTIRKKAQKNLLTRDFYQTFQLGVGQIVLTLQVEQKSAIFKNTLPEKWIGTNATGEHLLKEISSSSRKVSSPDFLKSRRGSLWIMKEKSVSFTLE